MAIHDKIYKSKVKYVGIFSFSAFYEFCFNWIMSDIEPSEFDEKSYSEKIVGDGKNIDITWELEKKCGAYFKYKSTVKFKTIMMKKVEVNRNGQKEKVNNGEISVEVSGELVHDFQNRFETGAWKKWRAIYEKWMIPARIDALEGKTIGDLDSFLSQAKAFLDLEGIK